jgi:hypothetical protein
MRRWGVRHPRSSLGFDRELELKLGEFNAIEIQQVLSSYRALEYAPSAQVVASLQARVRELNQVAHGGNDKSKRR